MEPDRHPPRGVKGRNPPRLRRFAPAEKPSNLAPTGAADFSSVSLLYFPTAPLVFLLGPCCLDRRVLFRSTLRDCGLFLRGQRIESLNRFPAVAASRVHASEPKYLSQGRLDRLDHFL